MSGFSNSKTIYDNENGYYSIYQSDRYGFNNPDNEWDSNETEILLVGILLLMDRQLTGLLILPHTRKFSKNQF